MGRRAGSQRGGSSSGREIRRPPGATVLILEGERALAEALAASLPREEGVADAWAAEHPDAAVSVVEAGNVDVVVAGMDSDEWNPLFFLRRMRRRYPDVALVAMSGDDNPDQLTAALVAGAMSWVSKQVGIQELATVVVRASRGEASIPPALLGKALRRLTTGLAPTGQVSPLTGLTNRERQILDHAARGISRRLIAAQLGLSVNTVRTHVQHILNKLGVHTTLEAVALVLREQSADKPGPARMPPH